MQEKIKAAEDFPASRKMQHPPYRGALPGRELGKIPEPLAVRYAPDGQVTYVNDAYCVYYRRQREQVLGRNFIQHRVPMDDLLRISRAVGMLSPIYPDQWIQHQVVLADGRTRRHLWLHKALFHEDGSLREFVAAGMDVTGIKDDDAMQQAHKTIRKYNDSLCTNTAKDS